MMSLTENGTHSFSKKVSDVIDGPLGLPIMFGGALMIVLAIGLNPSTQNYVNDTVDRNCKIVAIHLKKVEEAGKVPSLEELQHDDRCKRRNKAN